MKLLEGEAQLEFEQGRELIYPKGGHQCWHCSGTGKMTEEEISAVIRTEISKATTDRPHYERIGAFTLLKEPLSPEAGTLTRTFKPRREAIYARYAKEVAEVQGKLRRG